MFALPLCALLFHLFFKNLFITCSQKNFAKECHESDNNWNREWNSVTNVSLFYISADSAVSFSQSFWVSVFIFSIFGTGTFFFSLVALSESFSLFAAVCVRVCGLQADNIDGNLTVLHHHRRMKNDLLHHKCVAVLLIISIVIKSKIPFVSLSKKRKKKRSIFYPLFCVFFDSFLNVFCLKNCLWFRLAVFASSIFLFCHRWVASKWFRAGCA